MTRSNSGGGSDFPPAPEVLQGEVMFPFTGNPEAEVNRELSAGPLGAKRDARSTPDGLRRCAFSEGGQPATIQVLVLIDTSKQLDLLCHKTCPSCLVTRP